MPIQDAVPRLIQSVRRNSMAAPLELFIRIRDALSTLTQKHPLVRAGVSPRMYVDAAYWDMVPAQTRMPAYHATFLSTASTAVRHLLTHEAQTRLQDHPIPPSATSPAIVEPMIHEGASLEPRHLKTLLVLDDALDQMEACDALQAQIVEGRFYGQMSEEELAIAHDVPVEVGRRRAARGMEWLQRHSLLNHLTADRLQPLMMRP